MVSNQDCVFSVVHTISRFLSALPAGFTVSVVLDLKGDTTKVGDL